MKSLEDDICNINKLCVTSSLTRVTSIKSAKRRSLTDSQHHFLSVLWPRQRQRQKQNIKTNINKNKNKHKHKPKQTKTKTKTNIKTNINKGKHKHKQLFPQLSPNITQFLVTESWNNEFLINKKIVLYCIVLHCIVLYWSVPP